MAQKLWLFLFGNSYYLKNVQIKTCFFEEGGLIRGGLAPRKHLLPTTWALLITKEGGLIRGVRPLMVPNRKSTSLGWSY